MILIHSTHEAGFKVGGIGAVLDGLLSAPSYLAGVERTLLVGPMNAGDPTEMERLFAPRNKLKVRYFADGGPIDCPPELAEALNAVERRWGARLLYGTRAFGPAEHEILLVDASGVPRERLNLFKYYAWQRFGLDSYRYEGEYEYSLYLSMAQPAFEALWAVLGGRQTTDVGRQPSASELRPQDSGLALVCHEFMGLPLWYAAELARPGAFKSAYVAHEVPTARALVEGSPGHDTRFYNVMRLAQQTGLTMDDVFGDQSGLLQACAGQDRQPMRPRPGGGRLRRRRVALPVAAVSSQADRHRL